MSSNDSLLEALRFFHSAGVRFVLIGGLALRAHGSNYLTTDVDFVYEADSTNLGRLAVLLMQVHARILGRPEGEGFVITPDTLARVRFLNLFTDVGEVDVMRLVPGVDSFEGLWERAQSMDLGGFVVRVASLDDLIAMKRAANRPKDQAHLFELLALKKLTEQDNNTG